MGPPVFGIPIETHNSDGVLVQVSALSAPANGGVISIADTPIDRTAFPTVPPRAISLHETPQSVPESGGTAALLGLGLASLALARRKLS